MSNKEEKRRTYISIGELFDEPSENSLLPLHKRFDEMTEINRINVWCHRFGCKTEASCEACNRDISRDKYILCHYFIAEKDGGKYELNNLGVICKYCYFNIKKKTISEYKEIIRNTIQKEENNDDFKEFLVEYSSDKEYSIE
jgi:hypothetical protein